MASHQESLSMALFCDFENVALGVRDAQYEKFDIRPVLERLLLKGSIVVKKAYCDWDRYKGFKSAMHEANFELIEIPHVRQSGKNSADIRLVVDALDLCYTKSHVDTFVIISGDSDFSPLVSKLRENAKQVIGVGIKQSTSDLLIANCDEFIFYDDLVRESQRASTRREPRNAQSGAKRSPDDEKHRKEELEGRRSKAIELAVSTFDALVSERGDSGKMWASVLKEAIKRRRPDFNESYYGFRAFGNLLEAAQQRGLLEVGRDEKSGTYVFRNHGVDEADVGIERTDAQPVMPATTPSADNAGDAARPAASAAGQPDTAQPEGRRKGRGKRQNAASTGQPETGQRQAASNQGEPKQAESRRGGPREAEPRQAEPRRSEPREAGSHAASAAAMNPPQVQTASPAESVAAESARRKRDEPISARTAAAAPTSASEAARPSATPPAAKPATAPAGVPEKVSPAEPERASAPSPQPAAAALPREKAPDTKPAKAAKSTRTAKKAARKAVPQTAAAGNDSVASPDAAAAAAASAEAALSEATAAPQDATPARSRRARKASAKSAAKAPAKPATKAAAKTGTSHDATPSTD